MLSQQAIPHTIHGQGRGSRGQRASLGPVTRPGAFLYLHTTLALPLGGSKVMVPQRSQYCPLGAQQNCSVSTKGGSILLIGRPKWHTYLMVRSSFSIAFPTVNKVPPYLSATSSVEQQSETICNNSNDQKVLLFPNSAESLESHGRQASDCEAYAQSWWVPPYLGMSSNGPGKITGQDDASQGETKQSLAGHAGGSRSLQSKGGKVYQTATQGQSNKKVYIPGQVLDRCT